MVTSLRILKPLDTHIRARHGRIWLGDGSVGLYVEVTIYIMVPSPEDYVLGYVPINMEIY